MHLAYSAIQQTPANRKPDHISNEYNEPVLRYQAYLDACDKHKDVIIAIQKYIPGWMPAFNR